MYYEPGKFDKFAELELLSLDLRIGLALVFKLPQSHNVFCTVESNQPLQINVLFQNNSPFGERNEK
jgi:hypothetical protein